MSRYVRRNLHTGLTIVWAEVKIGAPSIDASEPHLVGMPMLVHEYAEFRVMFVAGMVYKTGRVGSHSYEIE